MKKIIFSLMTLGVAGLLLSAVAQDVPGDNNPPPPPPGGENGPGGDNGPGPGGPGGGGISQAPEAQTGTNDAVPPADNVPADENGVEKKAGTAPVVILPGQSGPKPMEDYTSNFLPPAEAVGTNNPDELRLNFRNAPLDMVLNYLSDAAGFIIVLETHVNGNVSVISGQPMTRDEAVNLLNSVLNKNGYAAIRNGRTLTIVDKSAAKTLNIPVRTGNNPDDVPDNAEIVTQIIPIRFVDAQKLVSDLAAFVSPQATVAANTDGNSIVVTDTQSNIRHLMEIIQAVDNSAESETEIRVFRLKYANPTDVATELGNVFPSSTSGSGTQSPIRFGGRGGPFGRFFGGGGNGGDNSGGTSSADRVKKATQVTAVADSRIQAVIVTAPKDLMDQIASMMTDLDVPSTRDQEVYVYQMKNGDPQQVVQVLQSMFQSSSSSSRNGSSSSSSQSVLQTRMQNGATTMGSTTTTSGIGSTGTGGGGGGGGGFGGGR